VRDDGVVSLADEEPTFSTVRMREGYDPAEVDEFVTQARAALSFEPPMMTPAEVEGQRFRPVRLRTGYDMGEVDGYLDRLADELRRREGPVPEGQPERAPVKAAVPWVSLAVVLFLVVVVLLLVR
jgi:DivIVA domain-containing protein